MERHDFKQNTKTILAQRAGYLCSICKENTIGPSDTSVVSVNNTGVAAHITAASPGGARYDINLTREQREGIENGVWLCQNHAKYIDGDECMYTAIDIINIKKDHEKYIQLKQSGMLSNFGFITKVELCNLGQISNVIELKLKNYNIIWGANGIGKSLICEMIASLSNKEYLERWLKPAVYQRNVSSYFKAYYFNNKQSEFSILIDKFRKCSFKLNGISIPVLSPPIIAVYSKESYIDFKDKLGKKADKMNLIELLSKWFKISQQILHEVIIAMQSEKKLFINDIQSSDNTLNIRYSSDLNDVTRDFHSFSTGEQGIILLEITLMIAKYYSNFQYTILLIERSSFLNIDDHGVNRLLEAIRVNKFSFQFIFIQTNNLSKLVTSQFTTFNLTKLPNGAVTIKSN